MSKPNDPAQAMFQAIAQLKTPEECRNFFAGLWNFSDLRAMEQRVELAQFLQQGREYLQVLEQSGASDEVVNAVRSAMLEHGSGGIMEELLRRE